MGDGLDPAVAVEFAAAYAAGASPARSCVGHDGRVSAPVFAAAVESSVTATGHDVLFAGPTATPTVGWLVRDLGGGRAASRSRPRTIRPIQWAEVLPARRAWCSSPAQGRALLDRWHKREFRLGRLGCARQARRGSTIPIAAIWQRCWGSSTSRRSGAATSRSCSTPATVRAGGMGRSLLEALGCRAVVLGGEPDGRYDHPPEPTEANLREFAAIVPAVGAAVGFAQDPDADRLAIVDENGPLYRRRADAGPGRPRRLAQDEGPGRPQPLDVAGHRDAGAAAGCPVFRTPVGEIHVVERMVDVNARLGRRGQRRRHRPAGRVTCATVSSAWRWCSTCWRRPASRFRAGRRLAAIRDGQGAVSARRRPSESALARQRPVDPALWDRIAAAWPDARADRRDGLRLDWDDRWVHVRASNTEPIVRVIAEAAEPHAARELAAQVGRWVSPAGGRHEPVRLAPIRAAAGGRVRRRRRHAAGPDHDLPVRAHPLSPRLDPPVVLSPGLYHGLQHRFGRLDYGRLIAIGLDYIARIPWSSSSESPMKTSRSSSGPGSIEGVVEHLIGLRRAGRRSCSSRRRRGLVIQPLAIYLGCTDTLTTPVLIERGRLVGMGSGPPCYGDGKRLLGRAVGRRPPNRHGRRGRLCR